MCYDRLHDDDDDLIKVAAPFKVFIRPRNEVVVHEYQDLEVECKLDQRITTDYSLNWNVNLEVPNVFSIALESFDDPLCDRTVISYMFTKTIYKTSCSKRTNSMKLKLYKVSPTKHGAKIRCILWVYGTSYEDTTTIYVQGNTKL